MYVKFVPFQYKLKQFLKRYIHELVSLIDVANITSANMVCGQYGCNSYVVAKENQTIHIHTSLGKLL